MDYSIPIPIKIHSDYKEDYDCICKYCSNPNKYVTEWEGYSYLWNNCLMCNTRVWYWVLGIGIKFVVCMEDEVHMWCVFIVVFHFMKKDVVMAKYTK